MKRRKVSFLVLFFLISSASIAFASITMFWPVEIKQQTFKTEETLSFERPALKRLIREAKTVHSDSSLNYRAWRHIQASA